MGQIHLRRFGETSLFTVPVQVGLLAKPEATREAQLLLDTGASTLYLTDALVVALGGKPGSPRYEVGGLSGPAALDSVANVKVVFGSGDYRRTLRIANAPVLPGASAVPGMADGVLGGFPLRLLRATVTIDYDTQLATLEWP